ncbi:unnamed protein product, partial [marine sediment metagenome]
FTAFYGKPWHRNSIGERFAQRFPSINTMLRALKADNYRRAAWTMQHEESSLFIGRVCRRLMRERPDIPVFTIHDSILTTRPFVPFVEGVLRNEFEQIGVRPAFEQEEYR